MTEKRTNGGAEHAAKTGAEALTRGYEQFFALGRQQVEKFLPNASKGFDDAAKFGTDNIEAAFRASTIAAKGFEAISKEITELNKKALEINFATAKALLGAKTVQEAFELQTGLARSSFDDFIARGTKISELSVKVAQDVAEPVNARVTAAVEQLAKQRPA